MADIFQQLDALNLLKNKHIFFLGDSNTRGQYKDLIALMTANDLLTRTESKKKCEDSFRGDRLISGSPRVRGRDYQEIRHYYDYQNSVMLDFMFITRVYNNALRVLFEDFEFHRRHVPDVIIISSCVWDVNRWGPNGVPQFKDNLVKLMRTMKQSLPNECLVIWTTAFPPSRAIRSSLVIKQIEFMQPILRFDVMEANTFARDTVVSYGFDVLDCHYHMRLQIHRRADDGLHFTSIPIRFITNLILTHVALSWDHPLPGYVYSMLLQKAIELESKPPQPTPQIELPRKNVFERLGIISPKKTSTKGVRRIITIDNNEVKRDERRSDWFEEEDLANVWYDDGGYQECWPLNNPSGPTRRKRKRNKNTHRGYPNYGYGPY